MIPREPNTVYLTGFAREAILSSILKWVDPVVYVSDRLNLRLSKVKGSRYLGSCPWCHKKESLAFNIKTTKYTCSSCRETGDLLDLVKEVEVCDTQDALEYLVNLAEACKKQNTRRKAKAREERNKERFGSSFEMMKKMGAAK